MCVCVCGVSYLRFPLLVHGQDDRAGPWQRARARGCLFGAKMLGQKGKTRRMQDEEEMYKFTVIYRLLMTGEGKFMYKVW